MIPEHEDRDGLEVLERTLRHFGVSGGARYALLRRDGRVLLALPPCRRTALRTLDLYQPQRGRAKLAKAAIRTLARIGAHRLLLESWQFESGGSTTPPGVLIGSSGHFCDRAVVVDEGVDGWQVTKVGFGPGSGKILGVEAEMLEKLTQRGMDVPQLRLFEAGNGTAVLRMDWQVGRSWKTENLEPILRLLRSWVGESGKRRLDAFPEWSWICEGFSAVAGGEAKAGELAVLEVPPSIRHGDLTRPNLRLGPEGQLCVHDWERGAEEGIPGIDLAHYLVQDVQFRQQSRGHEVVESVLAKLREPEVGDWLDSIGWKGRTRDLVALTFALNIGAGYLPQKALLEAALRAG